MPIGTVERIAVVALIVILFNGGMEIGWRRVPRVAGARFSRSGCSAPSPTAGAIAVFAHSRSGMDWTLAGLVGAAAGADRPAVMFSVLGRREIGGRSGTILEGEAGVNDPAGIALMLGMIELATHDDARRCVVGARVRGRDGRSARRSAFAGAKVLVPALRRLRLPSESLYPVLALVLAGRCTASPRSPTAPASWPCSCSGCLSATRALPYKGEIERFQASLAGLAELVGLRRARADDPLTTRRHATGLEGVALARCWRSVVRPLVVALTLGAGATCARNEKAFIAWSGLKGAVPVLLAAFAVLGGVAGAADLRLVFVVGARVGGRPGHTGAIVARALGIPMRVHDRLPWELSVRVGSEPTGAREHRVVEPRIAHADGVGARRPARSATTPG